MDNPLIQRQAEQVEKLIKIQLKEFLFWYRLNLFSLDRTSEEEVVDDFIRYAKTTKQGDARG